MNKYWWAWLLAGAGAAYAFGRFDQWQKTSGSTVPADAPRPPIPELPSVDSSLAPHPSQLPESYAQDWEDAADRYEIDFYPPEAEQYLTRMLPPPEASGVSTAPGCKVIAVGEDWWRSVYTRAATYRERGYDEPTIVEYTLRDLFPSCAVSNTAAALGLRKELVEWLQQSQLTRNGPEGKT